MSVVESLDEIGSLHPTLRSRCFQKSMQREQNCDWVQEIRSKEREWGERTIPLLPTPPPSCSSPPHFSPFFSHHRHAPSLPRLLAHLFNLSAWKRIGNICFAGYLHPHCYRLCPCHRETGCDEIILVCLYFDGRLGIGNCLWISLNGLLNTTSGPSASRLFRGQLEWSF